MVHLNKKKEERLKGDKLRDLILIVYLNNKWDKAKNNVPWLKEKLEYSTGGLYSALDDSGYFERKTDEIQLTEKGMNYLSKQILPQYTAFYSVGNFLVVLGFVFLVQWFFWTYVQTAVIVPWYSAVIVIVLGVLVRFFYLRIVHLTIKIKRIARN